MGILLKKKERELVVPGEEIIKSMDYLPGKNCFREGDSIYAKRLGLVSINGRVISIVPLSGVYIPKTGDMVIGEIKEVQPTGWVVDIKAPYDAYLPLAGIKEFIDTTKTDLSRVYDIGELIYARIASVSGTSSVYLSMQDPRCKKFKSGRIIRINPTKIPRVIGKMGSMINLIKTRTKTRISVGQNGMIWFEGEKEELVAKAIKLIEKQSQQEGLTDKVSELLKAGSKGDKNEKD